MWSYYSLISNAVLRGSVPSLRDRESRLNAFGLFDSVNEAESLIQTARQARDAGADVETEDVPFKVVAIHVPI
jgi:hypothetical protein